MKYELSGRIVFEAGDNVKDAFRCLSDYFATLAEGGESDLPLIGTNVKIRPLGTETPEGEEKKVTYRGARRG